PSEASGGKTDSGRGAGNPVKFRIVGETNGIRIRRASPAVGVNHKEIRLPADATVRPQMRQRPVRLGDTMGAA
ncbi:hypothetical protein, partial [Deinococcus sp.]|uniref:hypothetical protein n=1 Tax=Deinococcus sp. TaxID=47478 RepID=UPI003919FE68